MKDVDHTSKRKRLCIPCGRVPRPPRNHTGPKIPTCEGPSHRACDRLVARQPCHACQQPLKMMVTGRLDGQIEKEHLLFSASQTVIITTCVAATISLYFSRQGIETKR